MSYVLERSLFIPRPRPQVFAFFTLDRIFDYRNPTISEIFK